MHKQLSQKVRTFSISKLIFNESKLFTSLQNATLQLWLLRTMNVCTRTCKKLKLQLLYRSSSIARSVFVRTSKTVEVHSFPWLVTVTDIFDGRTHPTTRVPFIPHLPTYKASPISVRPPMTASFGIIPFWKGVHLRVSGIAVKTCRAGKYMFRIRRKHGHQKLNFSTTRPTLENFFSHLYISKFTRIIGMAKQ
jgi:hypothetical protein